MNMVFQQTLPDKYRRLSPVQIEARIWEHKRNFGDRLLILGHHYQRDEIIQFADLTGDSLKLSRLAAEQQQAEFVVFCGVEFMAESADILTEDKVAVILPDLSAGCTMADMATLNQVEEAWDYLTRHDGACCTSGNAWQILEWALGQGDKILFLPDQHLGRNTAYAMGYPLNSMALYGPDDNDLNDEQFRSAKFILWKGHCSVHQYFRPEDCDLARRMDPSCKIIVHPECNWEVVQKSDLTGSTEKIIKTLEQAPEGSSWVIGTEINLVHRLVQQYEGQKKVQLLGGPQCLCTTMFRIDTPHLLWCLDELAAGRMVNRITVDEQTKNDARIALQRMLDSVQN